MIKELARTLVFDIKAAHKSDACLEGQSIFRRAFEIIRNDRIKSKFGTFVMKASDEIMANLSIVLCLTLVIGLCVNEVNSNDLITYELCC